MPELPDVNLYIESLQRFIGGQRIERVLLKSPFVVRTFEPDLFSIEGQRVTGLRRMGKRIIWELENDLFLVFHLMIAGRFHWKKQDARPRGKIDLVAFHFANGTLMFTEASQKKRAALHVEQGELALEKHQPGGLEVLNCSLEDFRRVLAQRNHTVKRFLTDPTKLSGIGNAYSDEILHAARLSPLKWTSRLADNEIQRLYHAICDTLQYWINRLKEETGDRFPEKVTAFHPGMAVHGRFGQPCPQCGNEVQRIRYADNETNYCPACQTEGKILADRSLSRLLKDDWPRSLDELG